MSYYYRCVIDKNTKEYKEFVLVDNGVIQYYDFDPETEELIDIIPPMRKYNAEDKNGLIKPLYNALVGWIENATTDEIAQWDLEHPAKIKEAIEEIKEKTPTVEQLQTQINKLQEQLDQLTNQK